MPQIRPAVDRSERHAQHSGRLRGREAQFKRGEVSLFVPHDSIKRCHTTLGEESCRKCTRSGADWTYIAPSLAPDGPKFIRSSRGKATGPSVRWAARPADQGGRRAASPADE